MLRISLALVCTLSLVSSASAHFPWLSADKEGKVSLCFGETPAERNYKLPAPIAGAEVMSMGKDGKVARVDLKKVESDDFIGMASAASIKAKALMSKITYGMYAGSRLDYYVSHLAGPLPKDRKAYATKATDQEKIGKTAALDMRAQLVDTDQGVDVFVLWKGKPLADVDVMLFCEEGHEEGSAKTDKEGKVSFSDGQVEDGLNGIMVGHKLDKDNGELDGKKYTSSSHYLTITFHDPEDFE